MSYKPLKCNITNDIHDYWQTKEVDLGDLSKKCLRETLHFYTSRVDYHKACLVPDAMRVDLKDNEVSLVTDKEKGYHQQRLHTLAELQKKWAENKAKKQQNKGNVTSTPQKKKDKTIPSNAVIKTDEQGRLVLPLKENDDA